MLTFHLFFLTIHVSWNNELEPKKIRREMMLNQVNKEIRNHQANYSRLF